ncbi:MAG TPA: glycosyltransferase family 2 protein [Dermatophilaceae bacterium]|nr:glycosyltransferase family 2 protein [Dermatophilaceae bacterium]
MVVCTYTPDRLANLVRAVGSLDAQTLRPHEVIVVVDHNEELLRQVAAALPAAQLVASSGPRGLSGARNTGVRVATGDVVAFLDDDAHADRDWLSELTRHYADDSVIGVGGLVLPAWSIRPPTWFPPEFGWVVGCSYAGQPRHTSPVRNPIGANMSFRRAPLIAVGGFHNGMGRVGANQLGCEETEVAIRLAQRCPGSRILHEPAAVVHHHVPAERSRWRYFRRRCWAEGRSKAAVSRLLGRDRALASERSYVRQALPRGLARDARRLLRGELPGLLRCAATIAGLSMTTAGYLVGRSSLALRTSLPEGVPS